MTGSGSVRGAVCRRRALLLVPAILAGCAHPVHRPPTTEPVQYWSGRLAVLTESEPPKAFSAAFELTGNAEAGELLLFSPLGSTLAALRWTPRGAELRKGDDTTRFDSLETLAIQATGTSVPVRALFGWLAGTPVAADGWQADLSQLSEGRLQAHRALPAPATQLRLVLDR